MEQRSLVAEKESRQQLERSLLSEVERLQRQVDIAKQSSEQTAQCGEDLQREVCRLIAFTGVSIFSLLLPLLFPLLYVTGSCVGISNIRQKAAG